MQLQMDDVTADKPSEGFSYTFELPAVPSMGDIVHWAQRRFRVLRVEWFPHTPMPCRLLVIEEAGS